MLPSWLDRTRYPFDAHFVQTDAGRMHYVDTGEGPPVVMLHGNPTWSFMYRHLIRTLAPNFRCVAPDYIGFGLSDKPSEWTYRPQDHATHVEALITRLRLSDITLVLHDWGGPIGLSYALRHPETIRQVVILNTWLGSLRSDPWISLFSRMMGGPLGRVLIERFNAFARWIVPLAFDDRRRLSPMAHRHYLMPTADAPRTGHWTFPRALLHETEWLRALAAQRNRLAGTPALIVWGMNDPAFGIHHLRRWQKLFPEATTHPLPVGHYVAEEAADRLPQLVAEFLRHPVPNCAS